MTKCRKHPHPITYTIDFTLLGCLVPRIKRNLIFSNGHFFYKACKNESKIASAN